MSHKLPCLFSYKSFLTQRGKPCPSFLLYEPTGLSPQRKILLHFFSVCLWRIVLSDLAGAMNLRGPGPALLTCSCPHIASIFDKHVSPLSSPLPLTRPLRRFLIQQHAEVWLPEESWFIFSKDYLPLTGVAQLVECCSAKQKVTG